MSKKDKVATTLRLPKKKLQLLKAIASLQNKKVNEILNELIDQYLSQHQEMVKLLEEKNKSKQKKLKKLWNEIKNISFELDNWEPLEASLYDEISSGY